MKECPKCHTQYDDSMNFCTNDECQLVDVSAPSLKKSDSAITNEEERWMPEKDYRKYGYRSDCYASVLQLHYERRYLSESGA